MRAAHDAHVIPPIGAQGLNLGIRDVRDWPIGNLRGDAAVVSSEPPPAGTAGERRVHLLREHAPHGVCRFVLEERKRRRVATLESPPCS